MITSLLAEASEPSWPEAVALIAMMAFYGFIFWLVCR